MLLLCNARAPDNFNMLSTNTWLKLISFIRSPLRIGLIVLAAILFADGTIFASGPRARSVQSRTPSGWTGIDLRPQETRSEDKSSETEDATHSPEQETAAAEPAGLKPVAPELAVNVAVEEAGTQPALFQLPPRERRSRSYNTLKPPAPVPSPRKVTPPASQDPRNRMHTADLPRSAPSIHEFQQVLAELKQQKEAEEAAEKERLSEDYEDSSDTRPRSQSQRTASNDTLRPLEGIQSFRDRLLYDNILDEANQVASRRPNTRNDQLFMNEPLSTVRLNEILYYLESGDSAQVIRLAPGAQNNPYFNPPVSSEFQRSRAVYEQVFRSDVQTR
ncbi:MAG: hypothetical protein JJU20_08470 [Opitutales bacterium]|nr:hypothetical protein [Opitutales bacterium]